MLDPILATGCLVVHYFTVHNVDFFLLLFLPLSYTYHRQPLTPRCRHHLISGFFSAHNLTSLKDLMPSSPTISLAPCTIQSAYQIPISNLLWSRLLGLIYSQCLFWPPPTSTFFHRSLRQLVHVLSSLQLLRELLTGCWVPFEVVNFLARGKLITAMSLEFLDGKCFKLLFSINFLLILYIIFCKLIYYYNIRFSYSIRKVIKN